VNAEAAARRWADEWARGWREHDSARIAALYSNEAIHRSAPFREPGRGPEGARAYADWAFAHEDSVECWFGEPIVSGDRAAVEYWAVITHRGKEEMLAGVAVLRVAPDGRGGEQRGRTGGGRTTEDGAITVTSTRIELPSKDTVWRFAISDQRVDEKDALFFHKTTRRQFYDREMERQKKQGK